MSKKIASIAALIALALLASCVSEKCDCGPAKATPTEAAGSAVVGTQKLWETAKDGEAISLKGTIRRVGSDPFSRLVLTDADGHDWKLDEAAQQLLREYEQKPLSLAAILKLQAQTLADGRELPPARMLTDVSIAK